MARKKRHPPHEEHADETWLVPYSDLLTLLLALFIVLFASAQIDQKKFEQLAQSFSGALNGGTTIFETPRTLPQVTEGVPSRPQKMAVVTPNLNDAKAQQAYMQETAQLLEVKKNLDQYIKDNNLTGQLEAILVDDGLIVRIKDTALFPSGSAQLLPESRRLAVQIAKMLEPLPQRILISGHTDNVPINTPEFPSNWDLSSKRALNFMKFLLAQSPKLQPERFSAIGHGEYRPLASNDTAEGRSKNRRVEVLIIRNSHV